MVGSILESIEPADDVSIPSSRKARDKMPINAAPTAPLDVYVFGRGDYGELGLGTQSIDGGSLIEAVRPLRNHLLDSKEVGVVQLAVGSKHCVALTKDNQILTWGCNDLGALGRDTTSRNQVNDLNPRECTPTAILATHFEEDTVFVQVVATDSATFALTVEGHVYGWGTFLAIDGVIGFSKTLRYSLKPTLLTELKKIQHLEAGANHVLALDNRGKVFAWGCGQYNQLGRKIVERTREQTLVPREIGFPRTRIVSVACGNDHSFAIDSRGKVWTWGLNNYSETGIVEQDENGDEKDAVAAPTIVEALKGLDVKQIAAGFHHSLALLADGSVLAWGRCDGCQSGLDLKAVDVERLAHDQKDRPRYITKPTAIPNFQATTLLSSGDVTFALDARDGLGNAKLYSWGFSEEHKTGHGTEADVPSPKLVKDVEINQGQVLFGGCGDTFSVIAVEATKV